MNSAQKKSGKNVTRLPSDTPTALLAPSDFEHIYRDPSVGGKKVTKKNRTAVVKVSERKMTRQASNQKTGSTSSGSSGQEVLPLSIQNVVKKFVEKQKKTYTINK